MTSSYRSSNAVLPAALAALLALSAASACQQADPDRGWPSSEEQLEPGSDPSPTPAPLSADAERRIKAAHVAPEPHLSTIDWDAADRYNHFDGDWLSAGDRQALAATGVPPLLPPDPDLLAAATITTGATWYGAHIPLDGATLYIHATRTAFEVPGLEPPAAEQRLDGNPTLTGTDGIVTASFQAFGAAYSVHVECQRPFDDPRCSADEFVLSVVDALAVAGESL